MTAVDWERYRAGFAARVAQEAFLDAERGYWERRARMLEWAMPQPGEFRGQATTEELLARRAQLQAEAQACRNRARVSLIGGDEW